MTPAELAGLHRAAFQGERSWSSDEFSALLASRHVSLHHQPHAFALVRTVAGETELLTLAVHPGHQRQGRAEALLSDWLRAAQATTAFLEVAADNTPARQLYRKQGFAEAGRRRSYYQRAQGCAADAVLMTLALPSRPGAKSPLLP